MEDLMVLRKEDILNLRNSLKENYTGLIKKFSKDVIFKLNDRIKKEISILNENTEFSNSFKVLVTFKDLNTILINDLFDLLKEEIKNIKENSEIIKELDVSFLEKQIRGRNIISDNKVNEQLFSNIKEIEFKVTFLVNI